MCGRYTQFADSQAIQAYFRASGVPDLPPRYNIAPTQQIPTILLNDDQNILMECRWGLVPRWTEDLSKAKPLFNARAETLTEKPSFRQAFSKRRCLIPSTGFFEWKKVGNLKVPYFISRKDGGIFAMAGIYEDWTSADGEVVRTCTIITVAASSLMADWHDRMPAIISEADMPIWLDRNNQNLDNLQGLLKSHCVDDMEMKRVASSVNSSKIDSIECIEVV